jgi:hypothetical protein
VEVAEDGDVPALDPTPAVIGGILVLLVAATVIVYQYRYRRVGRALTLAAIGVIAVYMIPDVWPWSFARAAPRETAAPPPDAPDLTVSLDAATPRVTDAFAISHRTSARKDVAVHAVVSGVPSEFIVRTVVPRSRLEFPAGVVLQIESRRWTAMAIGNVGRSPTGRTSSMEAALGARLLTRNDAAESAWSQQWPVVLKVADDEFARYRRQRGRLDADIAMLFERAIVRAMLPLADRATITLGDARVSIVGVIRRATGCTVLLRRAFTESLFTLPRYRNIVYALRNLSRGEAVEADARPLADEGFSTGPWFLQSPRIGGRGFVLEQYELVFPPNRASETSQVDLDSSWLAAAELVMLETIPAGRISRRVTVEGFAMAP